MFLLTITSKQVLRRNQPPLEWVPKILSQVVRRTEREGDIG